MRCLYEKKNMVIKIKNEIDEEETKRCCFIHIHTEHDYSATHTFIPSVSNDWSAFLLSTFESVEFYDTIDCTCRMWVQDWRIEAKQNYWNFGYWWCHANLDGCKLARQLRQYYCANNKFGPKVWTFLWARFLLHYSVCMCGSYKPYVQALQLWTYFTHIEYIALLSPATVSLYRCNKLNLNWFFQRFPPDI